MSEEAVPPSAQLAANYKQLAVAAKSLNEASDEFNTTLEPIEKALERLHLGLECWVRVKTYAVDDPEYHYRDIGYGRRLGRWGILLRECEGDESRQMGTEERWFFSEAPRMFRVEAIEKVPDLLERLIKKADNATRRIKSTTAMVRQYADAIDAAVAEVFPRRAAKKSTGGE
jgi:hypothetical protein